MMESWSHLPQCALSTDAIHMQCRQLVLLLFSLPFFACKESTCKVLC